MLSSQHCVMIETGITAVVKKDTARRLLTDVFCVYVRMCDFVCQGTDTIMHICKCTCL